MNLNKPGLLLAAASLLAAPALGAPSQERRVERARWVMGTLCSIEARGEQAHAAVSAAFAELQRWDRLLSLYKDGSELNALNRSAGRGPFKASPELFATVADMLRLAEETGGAFDPTVLPLIRRGPAALPLVGWRKVRLDRDAGTIELTLAGMGLDSGAHGKGWALDRAAERLRERGISSARLNFGGQVLALGEGWDAALPGGGTLALRDASISVSGDSERPGHILSPFDGRPVRREAVAALLPRAADADAWSTALYVLGAVPPGFRGRRFVAPGHPKEYRNKIGGT